MSDNRSDDPRSRSRRKPNRRESDRGNAGERSGDRPAPRSSTPRPGSRAGWDAVAAWYDGWMGKGGSQHHRQLAVPAVINLLELQPGETVLDIGAGQGVLAPYVAQAGGKYTGVDVSPRLLDLARQHHGKHGRFLKADAIQLEAHPDLAAGSFDAVVFLLSLQDINPLPDALFAASAMLRSGGRAVLLMTHPCFRIPRQSGWGYDENRKLTFRRIDRYLTPLPVPMKPYPGSSGVTTSFHRPLSDYVNGLAAAGLLLDRMDEIPSYKAQDKPEEAEIPLFIGLRAWKLRGR